MRYKKVDNNLRFADLTLAKSFKHNKSLKTMNNLSDAYAGPQKTNNVLSSKSTQNERS